MKDAMEKVREFHHKDEVQWGCAFETHLPTGARRATRKVLLRKVMERYMMGEEFDDLEKIAAALADIVIIATGTALEYGIPLDEVFDRIHHQNMEGGLPKIKGLLGVECDCEPQAVGGVVVKFREMYKTQDTLCRDCGGAVPGAMKSGIGSRIPK